MARLAVSVGVSPANGISPSFISALDVTCGGVLLALPALLAVGLLRHTDDHFELPNGYYSLSSIFLLLAFLSLGRITSLEQLRYEPPGEWGKLLGLDRIPEVRTLRDKIKHLAEHGQPTTSQLAADQLQHRFMVIFDREGYSPALMDRLWQQRIAALTYRKRPGEDWPHTEFSSHEVLLVGGETVTMHLAERGVHLGGIIWVREIRRLTTSGHQTAIVTTWYNGSLPRIAATMFARWCQENFFAYMRNHYGLDKLVGYGTESVPDTTPVINPAYRSIDGEIRRKRSTLQRLAAQFGGIGLEGEITPDKVSAYEVRKAALQEEIASLDQELASLKTKRKTVKRHITFAELPEEARFQRLTVHNKHMIDTIKMVSYRAETAMSHILTEKMARTDDARALLRSIYTKEADLMPDEEKGTLTVRLHNMTNRAHDAAVAHLCAELNATETSYPGTNLRLIYELVSSKNTGDQEF